MFSRKKKDDKKDDKKDEKQKEEEKAKAEAAAAAEAAAKVPAVAMKGDLAIRSYRRQTKDAAKLKDRKAFELKLKQIHSGYKSPKARATFFVWFLFLTIIRRWRIM